MAVGGEAATEHALGVSDTAGVHSQVRAAR